MHKRETTQGYFDLGMLVLFLVGCIWGDGHEQFDDPTLDGIGVRIEGLPYVRAASFPGHVRSSEQENVLVSTEHRVVPPVYHRSGTRTSQKNDRLRGTHGILTCAVCGIL